MELADWILQINETIDIEFLAYKNPLITIVPVINTVLATRASSIPTNPGKENDMSTKEVDTILNDFALCSIDSVKTRYVMEHKSLGIIK